MAARKLIGRSALFVSLPLLVILLVHASPAAPTATFVCYDITENTTWTLALQPYVVTCDVRVNAGVTLTLEPGVVVKFETQHDDLLVDGRLLAQGTEESPIVFTSYRDDAHGGDTNEDGPSTPAAGDAGCVALTASSSGSILDHTWFGYGGYGGSPYAYASLHLYTSDATVRNSTFAWSANRGMHVGGVDPAQPLALANNTFLNNAQWAIYDDTTGARADITLTGNSSSGSANNGYGLMGSVAGTVTFSSPDDFPFIVWNSFTNLTVDAGSSLSFSPGTVVKFASSRMLGVNGRLSAQGTEGSPVVFTSYRDDAHGGDTNGDGASSPARGDWSGIGLAASSSGSILDHTWIGYGGYGGVPYSYANLHLYTSDATVQNNTIAWSSHNGIHVGGVDPAHPLLLRDNTFLNNTDWAVYDDMAGARTDISLLGNTSTGSANNGYGLKGNVAGAVTFSSPDDFPFVIYDSSTHLSIDAGSTLSFGPGTVVKFASYRRLTANGRFVAQGTEAAPVVFTSLKDDAHGGDTNGNGSATGPTPGDWYGIHVTGDAACANTSLLYAGYSSTPALGVGSGAEVVFAGGLIQDSRSQGLAASGTGRLLVSGSRIEHNQGSAVRVDGDEAWVRITGSSLVGNGLVGNDCGGVRNGGNATVVLGGEPGAGNTIMANAGFGACQLGTGTTMLATYNWWGDASGPKHATNPDGLGEEVSDRVVFEPWLSESNALPAAGLVDLLAPLSFSPGETINLGVQFGNVLSETLQDAVVVAQLPEPSAYVLSTAGGLYRPEKHDVIWRLGDIVPGEGLNAMVRIETAWGLPAHSYAGARALAAATNLPNPAVDLAGVLSYTPVVTVSQHYLTPEEIAAELAADPALDTLFQQAQALGFSSYEIALHETFDNGAELLTLGLLDHARMDELVVVQRLGNWRTILRMTSAYATQYNDAGGWRYDYEAGEWSYWGNWTPVAGGKQALVSAQEKSMQTCMRNGLIQSFGGFMDYVRRLEPNFGKELRHPCFACRYEGTSCKDCLRAMFGRVAHAYAREALAQRVAWMLDRCTEDKRAYDCTVDYRTCWHDPGRVEYNYVRWETCNPFTGDYTGDKIYLSCDLGQPCVAGCCTGAIGEGNTNSVCTPGAGRVSGTTCACETGLCSAQELEIRTAQDPNAKLGPAEAAAGEWLSYTVQYENVGAGTAYGVYVEDQLPPLLNASTLQIEDGGLYFPASRTVYWPVGELGPGAGGSLDFRVQVPTDAVSGTVIMNSATVYFPSVPETTPTGDVVTLVQDLVAHSQRVETVEGKAVAITLTGHSPAGPVSQHIVQGPGGGTLSGTPPNLTYTPAPNFEGPDGFTFRVSDGLKDSAPATVSILVHTGAEAVPPEVYATSPSRNETNVRVSDVPGTDTYSPSVYVYFSEPIDPATVTAQTLYVADGQGHHLAGYAAYDAGAYAARFVPQDPFQNEATYAVTVTTGVKDTSGNALAANVVWSFTTGVGPARESIYLPLVLRQ